MHQLERTAQLENATTPRSRRARPAHRLLAVLAGTALLAVASFGFSSRSAAVAAGAVTPANWEIGGSVATGAQIYEGTQRYNLFNRSTGQVVVYGEREYGINLVWSPSLSATNIRFERPAGASGAIKFDEPLAIYAQGGGYVVYQTRDYGINLGWKSSLDTSAFQWRIRGGPAGTPVLARQHIVLTNTRIDRDVVYGEREYGINLVWYEEKTNPVANILRPLGGIYATGTSLAFRAWGYDPEDGTVPSANFRWYSDRDGFLGSGTSFNRMLSGPTSSCSRYRHTITLWVRDRDGHWVSDNTTVSIGEDCVD
jgi:hypothetical protein